MPVYDASTKTIYTDGNLGFSGLPLVIDGKNPVFRPTWQRISSWEELLSLYQEQGITIQPMSNLEEILGIPVVEIGGRGLIAGDKVISCPKRPDIGALVMGLQLPKWKWYSLRRARAATSGNGENRGAESDAQILAKMLAPEDAFTSDHLGNRFSNLKTMCEHYGISPQVLRYRCRKKGMTLEEALTHCSSRGLQQIKTDHKRRTFDSMSEMAEHYGITYSILKNRLRAGWDLKKALETPKSKRAKTLCTDHKGKVFPSLRQMAKHYGISECPLYYRLKKGKSIEEALTTPSKSTRRKQGVVDHLGNNFPSLKSLAQHYRFSVSTASVHYKKGDLVEFLEKRYGRPKGEKA